VPGELPKQIDDMLVGIKKHLETFPNYAPHTIQRLAELTLAPRAHYKALASYLHAVDRVVRVTSGTNVYPLPPAIPDMSRMDLNGEEGDPASSVAWSNPTTAALGSDEALGGALLTPIPWLTRRSPEGNSDTSTSAGAQIHSESTETIDGPNGMGRIETVSVSINGIASTGHTRGVTQGELLRQEQRAGVVPVSQLNRNQDTPGEEHGREMEEDEEDDEEEIPHARGPEEIGVGDTGLQGVTTSHMGEDGVTTQGIDVEAAVGRRHDDEDNEHRPAPQDSDRAKDDDDTSSTCSAESTGTKREAEQELEGEPAKKVKEDVAESQDIVVEDAPAAKEEEEGEEEAPASAAPSEAAATTSIDEKQGDTETPEAAPPSDTAQGSS
jgi:hypothetical protein